MNRISGTRLLAPWILRPDGRHVMSATSATASMIDNIDNLHSAAGDRAPGIFRSNASWDQIVVAGRYDSCKLPGNPLIPVFDVCLNVALIRSFRCGAWRFREHRAGTMVTGVCAHPGYRGSGPGTTDLHLVHAVPDFGYQADWHAVPSRTPEFHKQLHLIASYGRFLRRLHDRISQLIVIILLSSLRVPPVTGGIGYPSRSSQDPSSRVRIV